MTDPLVTLGAQRYLVQRQWVDDTVDLRGITSVAALETGYVAVLFRSAPQVRLFDADGAIAAQWSIPDMVCPHHITAMAGGGALIADLDGHRVVCFDPHGQVSWVLGDGQPHWMAPFNHPTHAAQDQYGNLYVTDGYGNFCLHRFDAQRNLIQIHGQPGAQEGQFSTPHAIVISDHDEVFVADRENNRVQVFDLKGQFVRQMTAMHKPMALALTAQGQLLVSDQTAALSLFDVGGTLLGRCRIFGVYGHGVAADSDGAIYISEMLPDCLTRLMPIAD